MAGLVLLGLGSVLVWFVAADDTRVLTPGASPTSARTSTQAEGGRPDGASRLLRDLGEALNSGSKAEVVALAAPRPAARRSLGVIHDNVQDLGVEEITFRYIDGDSGRVSPADRRTFGSGAWVADVALSWGLRGHGEGRGTMEVALTLVDTAAGVSFGSAKGQYDAPAPLWLLSDLAVAQSRRALVAVANEPDLERYATMADQAVRDVRAVLPRWDGRLVVQVPSSADQLHRLLHAEDGTYEAIAAVTATIDGSVSPSAPVHILVNPEVFERLGEEGAQIVMSHEATHVAMDAAVSSMPLWLLEGFADYVALARSELPVEVTASQILAEVRRQGPPSDLPGPKEFDPSNKLLGSSYEAAWLANRLVAEEYGEERLIALYDNVEAGASVSDAFAELGTTERAFTKRWRTYLRELAG